MRDLPPAAEAALMSRSKPLALFVEMEFPGAPLYLNSSQIGRAHV